MTDHLRDALSSIEQLASQAEQLPAERQDAIAAKIAALADELYWETLLDDASRSEVADALAQEALADYAGGMTRSLNDVLAEHVDE